MIRVARLGLALLLIGILASPALAVATGTIAWNESHYTVGDTGSYIYTCGGVALCIINVSGPSGYLYNGTNTSVTGVRTQALSTAGTYTAYVRNGATVLDSDEATVSIFAGIMDVITAITGTFIPDMVGFIVAIVPLIVIGALVAFVGGFFDKLLDLIKGF